MPDKQNTDLVPVTLPTGETIWARVESDSGLHDTGRAERVAARLESLTETMQGVVRSVNQALADAPPMTATVEFGIEFALKSGRLISGLAELGSRANMRVQLVWETVPGRSGTAAPGPAADHQGTAES